MLIFGYTSDHYSRKWSLFASTVILIAFAALSAGSYGAGGSSSGLFAALTAWRFLLGIGIGGEYPAGSVGCAESTGELKSGTRNRWFILFTNVQIDIGFVVSALVPMIVVCSDRFSHSPLRSNSRIPPVKVHEAFGIATVVRRDVLLVLLSIDMTFKTKTILHFDSHTQNRPRHTRDATQFELSH